MNESKQFWWRWSAPVVVVFVAILVAEQVGQMAAVRAYVAPVLMLYLPFVIHRRLSFQAVGLQAPQWARMLLVVVVSAVILGAFAVVTRYVLWGPWPGPPQGWTERFLIELFFAALPEELFFRGWLQKRADERMEQPGIQVGPIRITPGNIRTSAAFALLHVASTQSLHRLLVFFPGLWFGWTRTATGSIWPAVILHAISNLFLAAAIGV